jgi:hypothetical protein
MQDRECCDHHLQTQFSGAILKIQFRLGGLDLRRIMNAEKRMKDGAKLCT